MSNQDKKKFKAPPKKYQPKGLRFLYEDRDILVVEKESGLLTVGTDKVKENTALFLLSHYVRKGDFKSRKKVHIVHRLDRDTSGVLIFAKTEQAQRHLQDEWPNFKKRYFAVVQGTPAEKEGVIESHLAENSVHRVYSIDDPKKGKYAKTAYKVVREGANSSLLEVDLLTGRKNQIRVHLTEMGHPVLGDRKYVLGKDSAKSVKPAGEGLGATISKEGAPHSRTQGVKRLALHSGSLTITHPFSKEEMVFETAVPPYFMTLLKSF